MSAIAVGATTVGTIAATAAIGAGASYGLSKLGGSGGTSGGSSYTGPQTTTTDTTTLNPETLAFLQSLVTGGSYSKQSAISDSSSAVTGAIQQVMQQYMPQIAASQKGAGMSGDSMTQILSNQLAVQAGVQGAGVQMSAINNYGSTLTGLINALTQGSPKHTVTSTDPFYTSTTGTATASATSLLSGLDPILSAGLKGSGSGSGTTAEPGASATSGAKP